MPDPWVVPMGPLDLNGSTLRIDNGSQVITDRLLLGGAVVVESGGILDAGEIALFDDAALTRASVGFILVDDATVNAASFSDGSVPYVGYLGIDNDGIVNTSAIGIASANSSIVIGLGPGGQFLGTGDMAFGANNSTFSLGANIAMVPMPSPDEATSIARNTSVVTTSKAANADQAMAAITQYDLGAGTIDPAVGGNSVFQVDGNASFGGAGSDVLIFRNAGSSFDVTGTAAMNAGGANSIADIVVLDSSFNVGNDWTVNPEANSSTSVFFGKSTLDVGGDWLIGGNMANGSNATFFMHDSTIDIGGSWDARLGLTSAEEITIEKVNLTAGGDLLFGGVPGNSNDSALSIAVANSTLNGGGDFRAGLGGSSVSSFIIQDSTLDIGGDYLLRVGQGVLGDGSDSGNSVQVAAIENSTLEAQNFEISVIGGRSSQTVSMDQVTFDLTGGLLMEVQGTQSDSTYLMENATGSVGSDFIIRGSGDDSGQIVVIDEFDLMIGGDLVFDFNAVGVSDSTVVTDHFAPTVGGDLRFHLAAGTGGDTRLAFDNFAPVVAGDLVFDIPKTGTGMTEARGILSGTDVTGKVLVTGNTTIVLSGATRAGDGVEVAGTLDLLDGLTITSGAALAVANTMGSDSFIGGNSAGTTGDGLLRILDGGTVIGNGVTVFGAGTIEIEDNHTLTASSLTYNGGTLRALEDATFANDITLGMAGIVLDSNSFDLSVTGDFSGNGGVTKIGAGTATITDADASYVGNTTVTEGALAFTGDADATGLLDVSATLRATSGGTFTFTGNGMGQHSVAATGVLEALDGSTLQAMTNGTFSNIAAGTLTDGTYRAVDDGAGASISFLDPTPITRLVNSTVELSGANSTFTIGGVAIEDSLNTIDGTLNILNGRQFTLAEAVSDITVGQAVGSTGSVLIDGTGSQFDTTQSLVIGDQGSGSVTVQNGGKANLNSSVLGARPGGMGTLNVTGPGSTFTNADRLIVGGQGTGEVNILNGGTVSNLGTLIGNSPGSNGTVVVDGMGSLLDNTNSVYVGGNMGGPGGTGLLRVTNGGTVRAGGEIRVWNTGTLEIGANAVLDTPLLSFDGGTLRTLANTTLPNDFTVEASGVTVDSNGFNSTLSGIISGPGGLTKVGAGDLTLSGINTYAGGTAINGGSLSIFSDQNLGAMGTPLSFDGGTLRTLAAVTSDRPITLNPGGGTFDSNGFNSTLSGVISGPGGLTKINAGSLTLSGDNTYTGDTVIDGGALLITGSIDSPNTFVNPGGLLGGTGEIGGNVFNSGVVSPGLSPGTLTLVGDYTQTAVGTLRVELASPTSFDRLMVGGAANLDGRLQVLYLGGFVPQFGQMYPVVTAAGGVNGTFSTLEQPLSPVVLGVRYEANDAILEVVSTRFVDFFDEDLPEAARRQTKESQHRTGAATARKIDFTGITPNQRAVAEALDISSVDPRQNALLNYLLAKPIGELPADFDRIAPEEMGALFEVFLSTAEVHSDNVVRRLRNARAGARGMSNSLSLSGPNGQVGSRAGGTDVMISQHGKQPVEMQPMLFSPTPDNPWGVWIDGNGEFIDIDDDFNAAGFDFETAGVGVGIDYRVTDQFIVGVAGNYSSTDVDLIENGELDVSGVRASGYASWFSNQAYLNAVVGGGYHRFDTRRQGMNDFVEGESRGHSVDAVLDGGYDIPFGTVTFGPIGSLAYVHSETDSFRERGSLAPLEISGQSADSLRSRLGVRFATEFGLGAARLVPELRAEWQHEFLDDNRIIDSRFANGAGAPFAVESPGLGRDGAILGAGVTFLWTPNVTSYLGYEAEVGRKNFDRHTLQVGFGWQF